jgi:VanZ family protein
MNTRRHSADPLVTRPLPRPWQTLLSLVATAYAGYLIYATHHPKPDQLVGTNPPNDKTLHFLAYGALAVVVSAAVAARGGWTRQTAWTVLIVLAAFAAADEMTQPFFGRDAEILDWVYDGMGMIVGLMIVTGGLRSWRCLVIANNYRGASGTHG